MTRRTHVHDHDNELKTVFWHRELPPLEADLLAEHTVEANSSRVPGTLAHRDELWDQCYREVMANAENRLVQEVTRLGGHFAHVHDESIDPKHDDAAGETRPDRRRPPLAGHGGA